LARRFYGCFNQRESISYYDLHCYRNDEWLYSHYEYDHHGEPASIRVYIGYGDFRRYKQ
jgi:hypothetical protein